jgi:hypothetical protein
MVRLEHILTADIFATDKVLFEIAFRPGSLDAPTDTKTIGEDYVTCEMSQSSTDKAFWSASVNEGFYVCNGTSAKTDSTNVCKGIADSDSNYTSTAESTSDWATPFPDEDPNDPWCTKANTKIGEQLSPYECSKLRCIIERKLNTGDAVKDLKFTVKPGKPDSIVIQPGRARLFINKSNSLFQYALKNDWSATEQSLVIESGAAQLILSAISSAAIIVALYSF